MPWLKCYNWEHQKFPREQKFEVRPEYRARLTQKLCGFFGLQYVDVRLSNHGGGRAFGTRMITLPNPSRQCSLGLVLHEVAHLVDHKQGGRKHSRSFKKALIKVYIESKYQLKRLFGEIRVELARGRERALQQANKEAKRAEKHLEAKLIRKSSGFKIERLKVRIKRLEGKAKRIQTLIKSARRSLVAYERAKAIKQKEADKTIR